MTQKTPNMYRLVSNKRDYNSPKTKCLTVYYVKVDVI